MLKTIVRVLAMMSALALMLAGSALAMELTGEWVNSSDVYGAANGGGMHGGKETGKRIRTGKSALSLTIEVHDGSGLTGTWCSPKACEALVGVVRKDGTLLMADEDSYFLGTMYGEEMELCTLEAGKDFQLATCRMIRKK